MDHEGFSPLRLADAIKPVPPITVAEQVTDVQLARYADLIYQRTGIRVSPQKKTLLSNRLRRRLRETGIKDFEDYYKHLENLRPADPEWDAFLQEITTHETYLFRDEAQWDWFSQQLSVPVHRRGAAGSGQAVAADLVGGVQHRRRAGDDRLLHCRLPAEPGAVERADPRHRHRRRSARAGAERGVRRAGDAAGARRSTGAVSSSRPREPNLWQAKPVLTEHDHLSAAQPAGRRSGTSRSTWCFSRTC